MSANISVLNPAKPKRILIVLSNSAVSKQTGWTMGAWVAEFVHPYWEFTEHGYQVEFASPDGGKIEIDGFSDLRHESGYSAYDILSLGFLLSPTHAALLENTQPIAAVNVAEFDAIFLVGGQSPMYTFIDNTALHDFVANAYQQGKGVAVVCHATCALLKTKMADGTLLVDGKTWTGFANSEEEFADSFVGMRIQPFWIEEQAKKLPNTNFITGYRFQSFAIRDGRLITGQQQFSGGAAAKLAVEALGV